MGKNKHGAPTSRRNRRTARAIKDGKGKQMFKGTTEARDAGLTLPTKDEITAQEASIQPPKTKK